MNTPSRLTAFQLEILDAFFRKTQGFYLTGGAALAGFHLGHRETHDLDLFTLSASLPQGVQALKAAASELGARCEETQTAPDFRRLVVSRPHESLVIDLVFERAAQVHAEKPAIGVIRIDPADEIFANKLCALLGRAEIRDLVDVRALEQVGLSLEQALAAGARKDGGLTAAQLAFVLSQIQIGVNTPLPATVTPAELEVYVKDLIDRLVTLAKP